MEAKMNRLRNAGLGLAVGVAVCLLAAVIVPVSAEASPSRRMCLGAKATIVGTEGDDHLTGTPHADVIVGLGGEDDISGQEGDDKICGGRARQHRRGPGFRSGIGRAGKRPLLPP